jgi:hypothetical protein
MIAEEPRQGVELQTVSPLVPPIPSSRLEEEGQALLIVDLLRLRQRFTWRRYRIDVIGFLAAWLLVAGMLALGYWVAWLGA